MFTQLAAVASAGLGFAAVMLVTTQEPAATLDGSDLAVRKIVRVCATLNLVGTSIQEFATPTGWMAVMLGALLLAGAVNHFCFCLLLRGFSDRIPNRDLSGQITQVMWGYGICSAVAAVFGTIAAAVFMGSGGPPTGAIMGTAGWLIIPACALGVGLLVYGIWYLVILIRIHRAIGTAVGLAQQTLLDPSLKTMIDPAGVDATSEPPAPQDHAP